MIVNHSISLCFGEGGFWWFWNWLWNSRYVELTFSCRHSVQLLVISCFSLSLSLSEYVYILIMSTLYNTLPFQRSVSRSKPIGLTVISYKSLLFIRETIVRLRQLSVWRGLKLVEWRLRCVELAWGFPRNVLGAWAFVHDVHQKEEVSRRILASTRGENQRRKWSMILN